MLARKQLVFVFGGLLASGATVAMVLSLRGGGERRAHASGDSAGPGAPRIKPARSAERRKPPTAVVTERAPIDVSKTRARVHEILASFTVGSDMAGRESLSAELAYHLRQLGADVEPATKARLLELLVTIEPLSRRLVGKALGALKGDEPTARQLLAIYQEQRSPDVYATGAIFDALGLMGVGAITPDLLAMLGKGGPHDVLVIGALGTIGETNGVQALIVRLGTATHPKTRAAIITVLGASRDPAVLQAMSSAAADADPATALSLAKAMGLTRDVRFAAPLRKMVESASEGYVNPAAMRALGRCADRDAALFLLRMTEAKGAAANVAARALHEIRTPDTVGVLMARWDETGPRGREAILEATSRLSNPSARMMSTARSALGDEDERVRLTAARTLGRRGERDNIDSLTDYIAQSEGRRELAAGLEALLRIDEPVAARAVLGSLDRLPKLDRKSYRIRAQRILDRQ